MIQLMLKNDRLKTVSLDFHNISRPVFAVHFNRNRTHNVTRIIRHA